MPFGMSVERFRNPGSTVSMNFAGDDKTVVAPHTGTTHWYGGYESQSDNILNVDASGAVTSLDFWTWYFIEEDWDYASVEAQVNGEWKTVPLVNDAGQTVTTDYNPYENNEEGNGLTGVSGGKYNVDANAALYAQLEAGYDLHGNVNTYALDVNADAVATAVITFAYDTSTVNDEPRAPGKSHAAGGSEDAHGHATM